LLKSSLPAFMNGFVPRLKEMTISDPGIEAVVFETSMFQWQTGSVDALFIQVLDDANSTMIAADWDHVKLTAQFDDISPPQVNHVPLGEFFGSASAFGLCKATSMMIGLRQLNYSSLDTEFEGWTDHNDWVGYSFFPMPFWKSARITL